MAILRKIGGSYYVLIPKTLAEFYDWVGQQVIVEVNSDMIVVKKLGVKNDKD